MRLVLIVVLAIATAAASPALAHGKLRRATPAVDATLQVPPTEVAIEFTEAVEPRFSVIEVTSSNGAHVDKGDTRVAPDNEKQLIVSLHPLQPGTYDVSWRITSVDTHKTKGKYTFRVKK